MISEHMQDGYTCRSFGPDGSEITDGSPVLTRPRTRDVDHEPFRVWAPGAIFLACFVIVGVMGLL